MLRTMLRGYDVFISYSRVDGAEYAKTLADKLTSKGLSVFLDQFLLAEEGLVKEVKRAIEQSRFVIILLSPAASHSQLVRQEVAIALRRNQNVIPVRLNDATLDSPVGSLIADRVFIDWKGHNPKELANNVLDSILGHTHFMERKRRLQLMVVLGVLFVLLTLFLLAFYSMSRRIPNSSQISALASDLRERGGARERNLEGVILVGANLQGLDFSGADLRNSVLVGADLSSARLVKADFSRSNLMAATLVGTDLRGTHLQHADLRLANLEGADLRGALLEEAQLNDAVLRSAKFDRTTVLPSDFDPLEAGMIYVGEALQSPSS